MRDRFRRLARHLDRRSVYILLGLVAIALILDWIFYTGFYGSDDISYIDTARSIANDGYLPPGFGNTRIGVVLPDALVCKLFGSSITTLAYSHIAYHLALIPIGYVLARLLAGNRAGLIAAALIAIDPVFFVYAGAVLPDNSATCCLGLSMIALVATRRFADPGTRITSWNRTRFLGYFAAGAMIGFCYWCKETAVIFTVPAAVSIILAGPSLRSGVWIQNGASFTAGLLAVFVLELLILRGMTGEWINRLGYMSETEDAIRLINEGVTPLPRFAFARHEVALVMPVGMWLLLLGSAAYALVRTRDLGVLTFFWFPMLFMTIGSTSLGEYKPPPIQARYYAVVVLVAIVMTAVVASRVLDHVRARWPRGRANLALVAVLAIVGLYDTRAALPSAGTLYRALDAQALIAAIEHARELHPGYPIVVAPIFGARMGPVIAEYPEVVADRVTGEGRPAPPYIYIRKAANTDDDASDPVDPDPIVQATERIDASLIIPPPSRRWRRIKQDVLHVFGAGSHRELPGSPDRWAEILVVRAR